MRREADTGPDPEDVRSLWHVIKLTKETKKRRAERETGEGENRFYPLPDL